MFGAWRSRYSIRPITFVVVGCIMLNACAQMGSSAPMSAEQQQLHETNARFATTTAEGALVGAVGGALIGYLSGGGRGALIGAGAGGLAGGVAGYLVAQNNYVQARTEQSYQTAIADAQSQTQAYERDAALSEAVASQAEARAADLNAQLRVHAITAAQYRASLASYQSTINDLDAKNAAAQKELIALQQSAAVTPGWRGAPLQSAAQSIQRDDARIAAAKERLRRVMLQEPNAV